MLLLLFFLLFLFLLLLLLLYLIITYALHSFGFGFLFYTEPIFSSSSSFECSFNPQNIVKRWNPGGVPVAWPCPVAAASHNLRFSKPKRIPS